MVEQDTPPPTITAMKIPIIKKGEYDICSMRMRQYILSTDHNLWDVPKAHKSIGGSYCSSIEGRYQPKVSKKSSSFMESNCFKQGNKPDIDEIDIDDLYNNLRNTSSTNEVSPASGNFGVSTVGETISSSQISSTPCADEVMCSFFSQQTTSPQLENEDLQQIDQDVSHPAKAETRGVNKNGYHHNTRCLYREY
ncbi:hypothetical protein Tco_1375633 [Tanacetum coccineum]